MFVVFENGAFLFEILLNIFDLALEVFYFGGCLGLNQFFSNFWVFSLNDNILFFLVEVGLVFIEVLDDFGQIGFHQFIFGLIIHIAPTALFHSIDI